MASGQLPFLLGILFTFETPHVVQWLSAATSFHCYCQLHYPGEVLVKVFQQLWPWLPYVPV